MEFRNQSDLEFADIDTEESRTYHFPGVSFTIVAPLKINVSPSGGHRIFDASGISHYIPSGWVHLEWKTKENQPNFIF